MCAAQHTCGEALALHARYHLHCGTADIDFINKKMTEPSVTPPRLIHHMLHGGDGSLD
jgi:hypothetical protein